MADDLPNRVTMPEVAPFAFALPPMDNSRAAYGGRRNENVVGHHLDFDFIYDPENSTLAQDVEVLGMATRVLAETQERFEGEYAEAEKKRAIRMAKAERFLQKNGRRLTGVEGIAKKNANETTQIRSKQTELEGKLDMVMSMNEKLQREIFELKLQGCRCHCQCSHANKEDGPEDEKLPGKLKAGGLEPELTKAGKKRRCKN